MNKPTTERGDRMRVLFLSDHLGYANGVTHGATTYFMSVLPQLASEGIDLTVCFLRNRHEAANRLEAMGIEPRFLNRGKWDPRALTDLLSIIRERRIQIIHAAGMKGILLGSIAARLTNSRAIIHLHDTRHPGMMLAALQRMVTRWSDLAVVVSRAVGELAIETFRIPKSRVITMHNPVDLRQFSRRESDARIRLRRELNIPAETPVIGITGRLSPEKGHYTLLKAMPQIRQQCPQAVLVVAGDGPTRPVCQQIIDDLELHKAVRLLGNRSDVPDILEAVDVIAVPSSREGLAYSALEAMAAGRPVVAFAVGGMVELLRDGDTGILVPAGDGQALARALVRVLSDDGLAERLARSAKAEIGSYTVASHVTELKIRYRSVLQNADYVQGVAT